MKFRPTDGELLNEIASLLEGQVMGAVEPELRHKVRVAANLCRILERQVELEPATNENERAALRGLLGVEGSLPELRTALNERIRQSDRDDAAVWQVLVETAKGDLATAKPGYDSWEGE